MPFATGAAAISPPKTVTQLPLSSAPSKNTTASSTPAQNSFGGVFSSVGSSAIFANSKPVEVTSSTVSARPFQHEPLASASAPSRSVNFAADPPAAPAPRSEMNSSSNDSLIQVLNQRFSESVSGTGPPLTAAEQMLLMTMINASRDAPPRPQMPSQLEPSIVSRVYPERPVSIVPSSYNNSNSSIAPGYQVTSSTTKSTTPSKWFESNSFQSESNDLKRPHSSLVGSSISNRCVTSPLNSLPLASPSLFNHSHRCY